ncbi:Hypothetical protein BQ3484_379 [Cedratvirus A11]|uniref:Uncharacterized protein n=1 Tax=Cedratvirus A11 TaxID=1903266 RepID=A0A1M7XUW3_9VIRU|nr:Hypothetical protein BQ3484_379 [Cedratvirus A11]SHO33447.1 Hypothetical protein BQ3484_379 [Cedratvirus A11]
MDCDFCGKEKQIRAVRALCSFGKERIILDECGTGFVERPQKCCSQCLTASGFLDNKECYKDCRECIRKIFPRDTTYLSVPLFSTHSAESESYSSVSFDRGGMTISRGGAPGIEYKKDCIIC